MFSFVSSPFRRDDTASGLLKTLPVGIITCGPAGAKFRVATNNAANFAASFVVGVSTRVMAGVVTIAGLTFVHCTVCSIVSHLWNLEPLSSFLVASSSSRQLCLNPWKLQATLAMTPDWSYQHKIIFCHTMTALHSSQADPHGFTSALHAIVKTALQPQMAYSWLLVSFGNVFSQQQISFKCIYSQPLVRKKASPNGLRPLQNIILSVICQPHMVP